MQPFLFHSPTRVLFGEGTISSIGEIVADFAATKPLLVTDKVLLGGGYAEPLLKALADSGYPTPLIFSDVPSDSDLACVRRAVDFARQEKVDLIIAFGGGSVLDTAKVVNIGISFPVDVLEFEGINNLSAPLKPFIAVPCTAGTGSEMSAVAMIKDVDSGKKMLFGSRFLYADVALLDPSLLFSLPPKLTAATGLDALTHCIEAYASLGTNVMCDALSLEGLALIFMHLVKATKCGKDSEARANTLVASTMAGISFTNAGVGVIHALSHTLGGHFGLHHGMTNAVFLPHGMSFNMSSSYNRYARCWRHLCSLQNNSGQLDCGIPSKFISHGDEMKDAEALVQAVKELTEACGLPVRLRDLGMPAASEAEIANLAEIALTDPAIMFNPKEASIEDLANLIKGAY